MLGASYADTGYHKKADKCDSMITSLECLIAEE
jgi:hypothetical protein